MERKFKFIFIAGIIQIVVLLVFQNFQKSTVAFMGVHAFKLGNRTVTIHPLKGTVFTDDQKEIRKKVKLQEPLAFIITGDSLKSSRPVLLGDYLQMEQAVNLDLLLEILRRDTTAEIISKEINGETLLIKQKVEHSLGTFFVLSRYTMCYPYYLRERCIWPGSEETPEAVKETMSAVEVKK